MSTNCFSPFPSLIPHHPGPGDASDLPQAFGPLDWPRRCPRRNEIYAILNAEAGPAVWFPLFACPPSLGLLELLSSALPPQLPVMCVACS